MPSTLGWHIVTRWERSSLIRIGFPSSHGSDSPSLAQARPKFPTPRRTNPFASLRLVCLCAVFFVSALAEPAVGLWFAYGSTSKDWGPSPHLSHSSEPPKAARTSRTMLHKPIRAKVEVGLGQGPQLQSFSYKKRLAPQDRLAPPHLLPLLLVKICFQRQMIFDCFQKFPGPGEERW